MLSILRKIKIILSRLIHFPYIDTLIKEHPLLFLELFYFGNFWGLRNACIKNPSHRKELLYFAYLRLFGSWIGLGAKFDTIPVFPHGLYGIFISNNAQIGCNVVIFQQVTIGSNTLRDSKHRGSPIIGDNVYIGAGSKIIGNCTVGKNSRIGANCIVTQDVPDNCVCVIRGLEIIHKEEEMDNRFISITELESFILVTDD